MTPNEIEALIRPLRRKRHSINKAHENGEYNDFSIVENVIDTILDGIEVGRLDAQIEKLEKLWWEAIENDK